MRDNKVSQGKIMDHYSRLYVIDITWLNIYMYILVMYCARN